MTSFLGVREVNVMKYHSFVFILSSVRNTYTENLNTGVLPSSHCVDLWICTKEVRDTTVTLWGPHVSFFIFLTICSVLTAQTLGPNFGV